jgi:hypothetical protein
MLVISLAVALGALGSIVLSHDINATVTITPGTCGISVDDTAITFLKNEASLVPGDTSDTVSRDVTNTGTGSMIDCRYWISGTDWTGSPAGSMESEQTEYECTDGTGIDCDADNWTALLNSPGVDFLGLDATTTASVDFRVSVPINQPAGSYSQTITITLTA